MQTAAQAAQEIESARQSTEYANAQLTLKLLLIRPSVHVRLIYNSF